MNELIMLAPFPTRTGMYFRPSILTSGSLKSKSKRYLYPRRRHLSSSASIWRNPARRVLPQYSQSAAGSSFLHPHARMPREATWTMLKIAWEA